MRMLDELKAKTGNPNRLTASSPTSEILLELESANAKKHTDACMSMARKTLSMVCAGINIANQKWDPFGVPMDDWKDDVTFRIANKGEFDDPLLQLVNEHRDLINIPPLLQITMGLGYSFYMHLDVKKKEMALKKQLQQQQEIMRRQEAEIREHRMQTRRQGKEEWERAQALRRAAAEASNWIRSGQRASGRRYAPAFSKDAPRGRTR